jgi:hypothetical protein
MVSIKTPLEIDIVAPIIGLPQQSVELVRGRCGSLAHSVTIAG